MVDFLVPSIWIALAGIFIYAANEWLQRFRERRRP